MTQSTEYFDILKQAARDTFWVPSDTRTVERPDVVYVTCPRPLAYLNQVLVADVRGSSASQVEQLVAEVVAAHAHAPSFFTVYDDQRDQLEPALTAAGYQRGRDSLAMAQSVNEFSARDVGADLSVVQVANRQQLQDSIAVAAEAFGHAEASSEAEISELLQRCTGPAARVTRVLAYDGEGVPIAAAAMSLFPALGYAYLWGGCTVSAARNRGAYSRLLAARVAIARSRGLHLVGVHAIVDTSAPILARLGFHHCGGLTRWDGTPVSSGGAS